MSFCKCALILVATDKIYCQCGCDYGYDTYDKKSDILCFNERVAKQRYY